jgi:TRAP-type mannitol/chloroaromatic compound transport system permease small subunit
MPIKGFLIFAYIGFGLLQLSPIITRIEEWTGLYGMFAFIIAIVATYIPGLGSFIAMSGSVEAWGWSWLGAAAIFAWSTLIAGAYFAIREDKHAAA